MCPRAHRQLNGDTSSWTQVRLTPFHCALKPSSLQPLDQDLKERHWEGSGIAAVQRQGMAFQAGGKGTEVGPCEVYASVSHLGGK